MSEDLVYGIHAVGQRLQRAPAPGATLYCARRRNPRLLRLIDQARSAGIEVQLVERGQLDELAGSERHQGCVLRAEAGAPKLAFADCLRSITPYSLLLVLDGVQDPHNLGACLRSADACGVDAVIIPRDRSASVNATVRKVAAGGAESVPVIEVTNLARSLKELQRAGVWIYGTCGDAATTLYDAAFDGPLALVMGAEGSGLRRLTREACDHLVSLPMHGRVESLNVSVATGVCLYEILRQRAAAK